MYAINGYINLLYFDRYDQMMAGSTVVITPTGHKHVGFSVGDESDGQSLQKTDGNSRPVPSVSFQSDVGYRPLTHQLAVVPEGEEFEEILREIDKNLEEGNEADAEDESDEDENDRVIVDDHEDPIFEEIKEKVEKAIHRTESVTSMSSSTTDESDSKQILISEHYTNIPFGIQPRATYEHGQKNADIMGCEYTDNS